MAEDENEDEDNQSVNWDRDEVSPVMKYWKYNSKIARCEMSHCTRVPHEFVYSQNGHIFLLGELRARHDFSLLLLLRAWQGPWEPERHMSFQPQFRNVVKTIFLSSPRLDFPNEVALSIVSFLNREWWPDKRQQCWSYECQHNRTIRKIQQKVELKDKSSTLPEAKLSSARNFQYCPNCHFAQYCSDECRQNDYKSMHKKMCCRPPLCFTPDEAEFELVTNVFRSMKLDVPSFLKPSREAVVSKHSDMDEKQAPTKGAPESMEITEDVNGDEEDGWESIDEDDEMSHDSHVSHDQASSTELIYKYFKKYSYDPRRPF
jgi:hypothetical protein